MLWRTCQVGQVDLVMSQETGLAETATTAVPPALAAGAAAAAGAAVGLASATGFAASAQPRAYGDRDRDGVPNYADRHDNRGGHRWAKGQRYDRYRKTPDWIEQNFTGTYPLKILKAP